MSEEQTLTYTSERAQQLADQEAAPKARALRAIEKPADPAYWAFIGQLQTNKAKSVVKYAHQVQSVDRASLIDS